jgi:hypothetical protein
MTGTPQIRETVAWKIWIAIRFIVFGVGGFVALWISWFSLIFAFDAPGQRWLSPFFAVPLCFIGALMMLYGGGQWGRWAYLWVFMSVPIMGSALGLLAQNYPKLEFLFATPLILILFTSSIAVCYLLGTKYYRRKDTRRTELFNNGVQDSESVK